MKTTLIYLCTYYLFYYLTFIKVLMTPLLLLNNFNYLKFAAIAQEVFGF